MKAFLNEYEGCFSLDLTAETMAEAATLVRMGMNRKAELRRCVANARQDGTFDAYITFGKRRDANSDIPHRGGK